MATAEKYLCVFSRSDRFRFLDDVFRSPFGVIRFSLIERCGRVSYEFLVLQHSKNEKSVSRNFLNQEFGVIVII